MLVTSDGTKMRWEQGREFLSMYLCPTEGSIEQLENKAQCSHTVLIYISRTDLQLFRDQHSFDARGHCSLRTWLQTRFPGDRLVRVETDL